jgi:O-methyltransferase
MIASLLAGIRRRIARALGRPRPPVAVAPDGEVAAGFLDDPLFRRAYAAGKATGSWWHYDLEWRAYVVCWAARHGVSLPGDLVECGVHKGGYARLIADYVGLAARPGKKFYLVDTYCGIPEPYNREGAAAMTAGVYRECYEEVVRTFVAWDNIVFVRGVVPDVLPEIDVDRVCFLSIDLNSVAPSVAALEHFWPRMSPGAIVLLDDYNFRVFADQKAGLDALAERLGVSILSLPTGQGLLVKAGG